MKKLWTAFVLSVIGILGAIPVVKGSSPYIKRAEVIYAADCIFVHDEINAFDGTIMRYVYCLKKHRGRLMLTGVVASFPDNFRVAQEGETWVVTHRGMEMRSKQYLYVKALKEAVVPFLEQYQWTTPLWIGQ